MAENTSLLSLLILLFPEANGQIVANLTVSGLLAAVGGTMLLMKKYS